MDQRTVDAAAIEAEVNRIRSLGIDALRQRWRTVFGAVPPKGLTKDILGRMIAYRIQEEAFGGLDRDLVKLLDRLARGGKPSEMNRRLKPGTVLVREYQGERHAVTIVSDGFLWGDKTYSSLSVIAQAITGTKWNGPRFFGLRIPGKVEADEKCRPAPQPKATPRLSQRRSSVRANDTAARWSVRNG
jgi:Protein of unknown function (DUF2924)